MADFVAVLRKTIGGLGETTPEMREKVFDKARATIEAKLNAIDPPPPAALIDRQMRALEEAIATVRADFAGPDAEEDVEDALETVLADFDKPAPPPSPAPPPAPYAPGSYTPAPAAAQPRAPEPAVSAPAAEAKAPDAGRAVDDPFAGMVERKPADALHAPAPERLADDRLAGDTRPRKEAGGAARQGGKRRAGLVAALGLAALALAAGGYLWLSGGDADVPAPPVAEAPDAPEAEPAAATAEDLTQTPQPETEQTPAQEAAAPQPEETQPAQTPAAAEPQEKFTQRLLPDGSEVDEGPAGGQPGIGEGSSVASAAQATPPAEAAPAETPAAAPEAAEAATGEEAPAEQPAQAAPTTAQAAQPAQPAPAQAQPAAIPVGQKAIFYEERTSSAEGSAEPGAITWSVVQESPGADLPPEPAIRADVTIPGKDVRMRMTIRRNGDTTLPAGHIVEMIFLTPEGFDGGTIANVSRVAFKENEQTPGNPLIGIPAKITDGFFLIALSDSPPEIRANLALLGSQNWLDIPIVYQSGRRALLSMEKGIPGERVFREVLRAWGSGADTSSGG